MQKNYFVQMSDGKTSYSVDKEEFNAVSLAMSLGAKSYQLNSKHNKNKNIIENRLINLNNVICLNEIIGDSESIKENKKIEELDFIKDRLEINDIMNKSAREALKNSLSRKLLYADYLEPGAVPRYDRDIDVEAFIISKNGSLPASIINGNDFRVPTFEIKSNPIISKIALKNRQYNIVDKIKIKAQNAIMSEEEKETLKLIQHSIHSSNILSTSSGRLTNDLIKSGFQKLYKYYLEPQNILINNINKDIFDDFPQFRLANEEEKLERLYGKYKDYNVYLSKYVDENEVLILAASNIIGVIPIREELEIFSADVPAEDKIGWVFSEEIGMAITNPKGIVQIKF